MQDQRKDWSAKLPLAIGGLALTLLVGVLGYWASQTEIAGAVIVQGQVEVATNRQVVQHPIGGVVGELLVRDSDEVQAGDVLLRLEDRSMRAELAIVDGQFAELLARAARLEAERDGTDIDQADVGAPDGTPLNADIDSIVGGQRNLFHARLEAHQQAVGQLDEQKRQIEEEAKGVAAELAALRRQRDLVAAELADTQALFERALVQKPRVRELQRAAARIDGDIGQLTAATARLAGRLSSLELEKLQLTTMRREDAIADLRDLDVRKVELVQKRAALRDALSKLELRAPVSGVVHGMTVFGKQAVVRAAEPVLYLVPNDQPLVIAAQVEAVHIDEVFVGQPAILKFASFDQRTTPEIHGAIVSVSPDVVKDDRTGATYYVAEVEPDLTFLEIEDELRLLPGMPVEVFVQTGERTPLNFLTQPLTDYFDRAFREG